MFFSFTLSDAASRVPIRHTIHPNKHMEIIIYANLHPLK